MIDQKWQFFLLNLKKIYCYHSVLKTLEMFKIKGGYIKIMIYFQAIKTGIYYHQSHRKTVRMIVVT